MNSLLNGCVTVVLVFLSFQSLGQQNTFSKTPDCEQKPIDRFSLVSRHNVIIDKIDPLSPVQVGNGDFAFTADVTGLQSFGEYYYKHGIPLETRTSWTWHSFPNTKNLKLKDAMKELDFHGRKIAYASLQNSPAGDYFRKNPHPVPMGRIGLVRRGGEPLELTSISNIDQKLDLWTGLVTSKYKIDGQPVTVETVSHPESSLVAFKIISPLLRSGDLKINFHFPYSYDLSVKNKPPLVWNNSENTTSVIRQDDDAICLKRMVDTTAYYVGVSWQGNGKWETAGDNQFFLSAADSDSLLFVCDFAQNPISNLPLFEKVKKASAGSWGNYWTKGGAIDFSGSKDSRAGELERRIVLSQYLMKVNYAGSFPPQESGLTYISWYGKHNSEVYWLHAAQFYQWNRTELLEKGLQWYKKILPSARADASSKGFEGAKWPKMAGIYGRPSPGSINPFIIWNEPNVIYLSELVYRAHPDNATLEKYKDLVFESAKFLASYAYYDAKTNRYILGPPVKSVNESNAENETQDPGFELAYWYYGLKVAQDWRERLGMPRLSKWDDILKNLARMTVQDGKYVQIETEPEMYNRKGNFPSDMIMALGYLPQTPMVDKEIMKRTFDAILQRNGLNSFVSWSLGKGAMTAARLGECKTAVDILCNYTSKNQFSKSGFVQRPKEIGSLANPAYFPVNSSFLAAVALMAGGWDGAPGINAPGFPHDGSWCIRVENMNKLP